jgi:hypothetical protein
LSEVIADYQPVAPGVDDIERSTIAAVSYRVIPFLVLAYFFCVLDRVNVSFAALTMNADLGFSPLVYAWGAGIFFIGYFVLEIPSNIALHRFGSPLRRPALDRAYHGHMGGDFGCNGVYHRAHQLLRVALSARPC